MTKKTWVFLIIIIALAFVLRIYNITKVPPSPDWDEVSLGYNTYSILKTGKDEFGNFLPLTLRSFNDYKPAFYVYTAIPSIAIFGLNVFSARLPSVIMGVTSVIGVFFLCEALRKYFKNPNLTSNFSLLSSFLLAISPWHLQFSRAAFEVNSALFLLIWGAVFFLYGLQKPFFLLLSSIFYALSLYAYHSARVFVPFLLLIFFVLFKNKLLATKKYFVTAFLIGFVISLPAILILFSPEGSKRFAGVSIYSDQTGLLRDSVKKIDQDKVLSMPFGEVLHNRRVTYVLRFIEGYFWHFTPQWLFLSGDGIGRHHAPDMGLLYLIELPFVLIGLYQITNSKGKGKWFVLAWFLAAPIAAAPTNQIPHAVRSYFFLPTFQIFSAIGILTFYKWLAVKKLGPIFFTVFCLMFLANVFYYLEIYHYHLSYEYASYWQYGYKEAIEEVQKQSFKYQKIVFSGKLEQPYIFYLFYTKYDPQKYLQAGGSNTIDFKNWSHLMLGKYEFKFLEWNHEKRNSQTLYVGRPQDFPEGVKIIKTIKYPNNDPAIYLVEG